MFYSFVGVVYWRLSRHFYMIRTQLYSVFRHEIIERDWKVVIASEVCHSMKPIIDNLIWLDITQQIDLSLLCKYHVIIWWNCYKTLCSYKRRIFWVRAIPIHLTFPYLRFIKLVEIVSIDEYWSYVTY